jgi:phage FluMu protein Com
MVIELVKERENSVILDASANAMNGEVIAYCPNCKAVQTVVITDGKLIQTRKYVQYENRVYHDCGSLKSCRLYRTF